MLSKTVQCSVVLCFVFGCQFIEFVESVSFEQDVRISFEQKMAIDKLRRRVLPYITEEFMKDDIYLVRWLRGSNFDIQNAEKKLIENIKWRKENKLQTIDREDFSDVAQEYPYYNNGVDKEGRPVFIAFVGDWDLRGAVVTGRVNRVLRYLDQGLETLSRRIRTLQREGKNVTQAILILDLSQFSLVQHACVQCLMRLVDFLHSYENHYPGTAEKVFFIDAPPAVMFAIELVRNNVEVRGFRFYYMFYGTLPHLTVSKETRDAIKTYGTNKENWKSALLKQIDSRYLPKELGGTASLQDRD